MRRHAGTRIEFEQHKTAVGPHHQVNAAPAAGAQNCKGFFARRLHGLSNGLRQFCRAVVFDGVAEILVLIVVVARRRLDFNHGQGLASENSDRKLTPEAALLHENLAIKLQGLLKSITNRVNRCVLEFRHADRRALAVRLYDDAAAQTCKHSLRLIG